MALSIRKFLDKGIKKYDVLMREPKVFLHEDHLIQQSDFHVILAAPNTKELFASLKNIKSHGIVRRNFTPVKNPQLCEDLLRFEITQSLFAYKVGVMYYKDEQDNENQMFNNLHGK